MREDDSSRAGFRDPVAIPTVDQLHPRAFARGGGMDHAARFILPDSLAGAPGCELPRRQTLPFLALAADIGHLDAAMPLRDRAERRSRFDRLELLGIAHPHDQIGRASCRERVCQYV